MKEKIKNLILDAATDAYKKGQLTSNEFPPGTSIEIEVPKIKTHGDFSTNFAMVMASVEKMNPRKIGEVIMEHINDPEGILEKVEMAGPGFINFFINRSFWHLLLREINEKDTRYGASNIGKSKKVQVEFVSANPTGPLHVGHGRGAAVGDSVANILKFCGYDVEKEYYINDSGRQIKTLGESVYLRYRQMSGEDIQFPPDCYQGDYIRAFAKDILLEKGAEFTDLDEEKAIEYCAKYASKRIISQIRKDLEDFSVHFDNWYSEQSLYDSGKVNDAINGFKEKNTIYEKEGALWFKTSDYGDEKDRVVVRSNGLTTYFASDIAYHIDKFERGFKKIIDVWGADHHGYVSRVKSAIEASGRDKNQFYVILVQLVNLLRGGEPVAMSTRSGEFVTLKDVVSEVGADAARFIFLTRHYDSHLDFDLELAKKKTNDNPVFYVQYVHARISSILRKGREQNLTDIVWDKKAVNLLKEPEEINLIKTMGRYPEVILNSAEFMEPHRITFYLMDLASSFHAYYNKHRVLTNDPVLSRGRLYLIIAVRKIIRNGLTLLGVTAPEKM